MNKTVAEYFAGCEREIPEVVDLRGLEVPEPMERILLACMQLKRDDIYIARLPHVPNPLFPHLKSRGLNWQVFEEADDSVLVLIQRND